MADSNRSTGALAGLRVLDLTGRMGGYCGLLLANLGAEVLLIEPPGGDPMRREGPFKNDTAPWRNAACPSPRTIPTNMAWFWISKMTKDRENFVNLSLTPMCVIEDKPYGYLDQLRLGYADLQTLNPALVLTSISGFGRTGPYREFKAPSIVAFAMGGLMNLCGHPGHAPLMGPCDVAYHLGSVHAAFGTMVALFNRRATGAAIMSMYRCKTCWRPIRFCASSAVTALPAKCRSAAAIASRLRWRKPINAKTATRASSSTSRIIGAVLSSGWAIRRNCSIRNWRMSRTALRCAR